jgi:hypothetical protein
MFVICSERSLQPAHLRPALPPSQPAISGETESEPARYDNWSQAFEQFRVR